MRDSKVIIYGIDEKQGTAQVIPYEYDCESDAYIQNEHLSYTRQDSFFREATKEAVYWKMQSDRSNPKDKQEDLQGCDLSSPLMYHDGIGLSLIHI